MGQTTDWRVRVYGGSWCRGNIQWWGGYKDVGANCNARCIYIYFGLAYLFWKIVELLLCFTEILHVFSYTHLMKYVKDLNQERFSLNFANYAYFPIKIHLYGENSMYLCGYCRHKSLFITLLFYYNV